ncbi:Spx/MgsR family RNA polymerase-binding regulatory protein [Acinetobacter rudis]|uniref:Spx/MgsR family RNA polymerase-binding regulatory protein n=1 Tax=Acinetobacter rudis TaxID=632955 RepID=A0AAW8J3J2_9GAMM|nr:Spx/MgsR family RNA polymerase-binding regulatory protein [Acinetobacter rudis]MDQ8934250.1 Spx/MgsR family RNA polymerase-binding regulatory protein [Acinetobacter rudis]MDQ8952593.1 Spx/MgsR family RNA polymerase-binding regulatory protein [Acinetobacter rudis]MDQ9016442.1 Spx/MgsR family RNA polymerase-binding regulatory protein [Acinetobacter rudis]
MIKIYGIKNCNSMKKAFDLLNELNITFEFHDYKKQGIDTHTLQTWITDIGADIVLNKKGTTWRKLSPEQQALALSSTDELIQALSTHTSLIKRPVLQNGQDYIVGFDEERYRALKATTE